MQSSQAANPVLVEVTRGNAVENIHRGAFCIADSGGTILAATGDIERPIFPRSAVKLIQALALFRSGAAERFALTPEELAIACASHHGEALHQQVVLRLLGKLALSVDDLECGPQPPSNRAARKALADAGKSPTALHNNCSGKHAGMLAVARALNVPTAGYVAPDHPVQQLVTQCLADVTGHAVGTAVCGTDGCSIPTMGAPLQALASGFARVATGTGLSDTDAAGARQLGQAVVSHPFLVAGTGATDTEIMDAFGGRVIIKIGAEGVFCGAVMDRGWGFALKCDDGNMRAAEAMVGQLLMAYAGPDPEQTGVLERRARLPISNWNKIETGEMRARPQAFRR